jgi:hypothetical protein
MGPAGFRRRGRRRGLAVGLAAGAAMSKRNSNNNQPEPQEDQPAAGNDMTAQLEELQKLKDQGILTQEEFDAKKKQILGI